MGRGQAPAAAISMTVEQELLLQKMLNKHTLGQQISKRIKILLLAKDGQSNSHIKRVLGISLNTVKLWRSRWTSAYPVLLKYESSPDLYAHLFSFLQDLPRSGTPKTFTFTQEQKIVALACDEPCHHGLEMTVWTHEMLALIAIAQNIVHDISARQIGRILKNAPTPTTQIGILAVS